ncbi:hypothetical protein BDZ91DRAFT_432321 [Kalaharituber pfeilii]|nr:hypothetical protein BDZ91DRAFT_432321 [Kalaharituber pfeilii]
MDSLLREGAAAAAGQQRAVSWVRKLVWTLVDKRGIERLVVEFEEWTSRMQTLLESACWRLPNWETLEGIKAAEKDGDVKDAGLLKGVGVRKLVVLTPGEKNRQSAVGRLQLAEDNAGAAAFASAAGLRVDEAVSRLQIPPRDFSPVGGASGSTDTIGLSRLQQSSDPGRLYLAEHRSYADAPDAATAGLLRLRAIHLAVLLHQAAAEDGDLRVLQCVHFFDDVPRRCVGLIYALPPECTAGAAPPPTVPPPITVASLATLLAGGSSSRRPTLQARMRLALSLARSVARLHAYNWVHQMLSPSAVLFFTDATNCDSTHQNNSDDDQLPVDLPLPVPYLANFAKSRPSALFEHTPMAPSTTDLLYIHPARWGDHGTRFEKKFDVYSLGVMLLEIGLWERADQLDRGRVAKLVDAGGMEVKKQLVKHAERRLGFYCGGSYRGVVLGCLEGVIKMRSEGSLEEGDEGDGDGEVGGPGRKETVEVDVVEGFAEGVVGVLERLVGQKSARD